MGGSTSIIATASWWKTAKATFTSPGFLAASANFKKGELDVDLSGKTIVVTGANSGLGFSIASSFAERGATTVLVCRNAQRGQAAVDEIKKKTNNANVRLEVVDIARPGEVLAFARRFIEENKRLDVLVNNAGAMFHVRGETPEGYENTFALHSLGTYLLTESLMPVLEATKPQARVITMTSGGLYTVKMDAAHFQSPLAHFKGDGLNSDGALVYSQCKRHQLYMTQTWAKKYPSVFFASTHPGWARTEGTKDALPKWFDELPLRTAAEGADCTVWLGITTDAAALAHSGALFFDRAVAPTDYGTASSPEEIGRLEQYLSQCKANEEARFKS